MAPSNSKTNFKSFEVQARLLRAMVAAHPEVKWNYKEIQKCYGSDLSEHGLGHKMRHLRTQATIIRKGLDLGCDPATMPTADNIFPKDQNKIGDDICKYFGESTPDGIQFQFRSIKKDAASLKSVADSGENPAGALSFTSSTPSKRSPTKSTPGTGRSLATPKSAASRKKVTPVKREFSDEDDEASEEVDYKARDLTPTPVSRPPMKRAKPSPGVGFGAGAGLGVSVGIDGRSESEDNVQTPTNDTVLSHSQPMVPDVKDTHSQPHSQSFAASSFTSHYSMNETLLDASEVTNYENMYFDGEI